MSILSNYKYLIENKNTQKYILLFIGISIIVSLGIILTHDLQDYMDIDLGDELGYLTASKGYFYYGRILYPLWYKFINLFAANTVDLFFLNQKVLIILLPVCLFVLLFELFNNFISSLLFSCLFLYSNTNIATEFIYNGLLVAVVNNKVTNFTLIIICILSYLIMILHKRGYSLISLLTISFFILTYCRNEYGLFFILTAILYIYYYLKELRNIKREKYTFLIFGCTVLLVIIAYGFPLFEGGYYNLHYLFSYSRNYMERNNLPMNSEIDVITPCIKIFGNHSGLLGFFIGNPVEFINNLLYNIYNMIVINSFRLADILFPQVLFPYKDKSLLNYVIVLVSLFLLLVTGICAFQTANRSKNKVKLMINKPVIYFNSLLIVTAVLANIIYYFDPRFYIFFVPAILISIHSILHPFKEKAILKYLMYGLMLFIIIMHPSTKDYCIKNKYPNPPVRYVADTYGVIKKYLSENKKTDISILSNLGEFGALIPEATTSTYSIMGMLLDSNYLSQYKKFEEYDVIIINEIKPKQNYPFFNNLSLFVKDNDTLFKHITFTYSDYGTGNIYLRKPNHVSSLK
jgi:hypothetical protein